MIVTIDPDMASRTTIERVLGQAGYEVVCFPSAPAGLRFCEGRRPELVIVDTDLPAMSGFEAVHRLNEAADVPALFVTCRRDEACLAEVARLGGYGCLPKPIDPDTLTAATKICLSLVARHRKTQEERDSIQQALNNSRVTSAAIGMLMERHRLCYAEGFEALRSYARSCRISVLELAQTLIDNVDLVNRINLAQKRVSVESSRRSNCSNAKLSRG